MDCFMCGASESVELKTIKKAEDGTEIECYICAVCNEEFECISGDGLEQLNY